MHLLCKTFLHNVKLADLDNSAKIDTPCLLQENCKLLLKQQQEKILAANSLILHIKEENDKQLLEGYKSFLN